MRDRTTLMIHNAASQNTSFPTDPSRNPLPCRSLTAQLGTLQSCLMDEPSRRGRGSRSAKRDNSQRVENQSPGEATAWRICSYKAFAISSSGGPHG